MPQAPHATDPHLAEITERRLANWKLLCHRSQTTPVLLVGLGNGENAGTLLLGYPEEVTNAELRALLLEVLQGLD